MRIPVIANGDIATPEQAQRVLRYTGADAIMIGRAAQGRPWIFREIRHYLDTGAHLPPPTVAEARAAIVAHLDDHYAFYGEAAGVRIARKHLGWYTKELAGGEAFRREVNAAGDERRAACRGRPILRYSRRSGRAARLSRAGRGDRGRPSGVRRSRQESQRGGEALAA